MRQNSRLTLMQTANTDARIYRNCLRLCVASKTRNSLKCNPFAAAHTSVDASGAEQQSKQGEAMVIHTGLLFEKTLQSKRDQSWSTQITQAKPQHLVAPPHEPFTADMNHKHPQYEPATIHDLHSSERTSRGNILLLNQQRGNRV